MIFLYFRGFFVTPGKIVPKFVEICDEKFWRKMKIYSTINTAVKILKWGVVPMSKTLFSTLSLSAANGAEEECDLEYYITETPNIIDGISISTYGIEIVKTRLKREVQYAETKTIDAICASEKTIKNLAALLKDHAVTPITLEDVISDITCANENDYIKHTAITSA
jgi:hypothetical protein